jgi:diaminopimelate decarboxylase
MKKQVKNLNLKLIIEPGILLVANSSIFVTRVTGTKMKAGKKSIVLDS